MDCQATPHSAIKKTPNIMMLAREVRLPAVLMTGEISTMMSTSHYIERLTSRLQTTHNGLGWKLQTAVDMADQLLMAKQFCLGKPVWLSGTTPGLPRLSKLVPRNSGPHEIKKS